jgi:uncharacterized protein (TIGR03437 family)
MFERIAKNIFSIAALGAMLACSPDLTAATFGRAVVIGGQAADLALDEARGVLYVANFTANRVEVISLADASVQTSMNVSGQPASLSLSPDGRWLLVSHYGNFAAPSSPRNSLTLIDLNSSRRQTFVLGSAPLGVAFGLDNQALVVTTSGFSLFDPTSGAMTTLSTMADFVAKTLPVELGRFPTNMVSSSMASSFDRGLIYGTLQNGTDDQNSIHFSYNVRNRQVVHQRWISSPVLGPRAVSVNRDGTRYVTGWSMRDRDLSVASQFPGAVGTFEIGGHAFDHTRPLLYSQIPEGQASSGSGATGGSTTRPASNPVLMVLDDENLTVLERLQLPEFLQGRAIVDTQGRMMYGVSESGVLFLPVGSLQSERRVQADIEDLVFRGNFCDRTRMTQEFTVRDLSGGSTDFRITSSNAGVTVTQSSTTTPATVRVQVNPASIPANGTTAVDLNITSSNAINLVRRVRVLVNNREPDQRGVAVNLPGKLVDILADPTRDRVFVIRQDLNQIIVLDGSTYSPVATLKTGNTPTQLAITFDRRHLLIGHDNSQHIFVYNLETLQREAPIRMPGGHYPKSIASAGGATLAASRVAGPMHKISIVDMQSRTATELPSLDVFNNDIDVNTVLVANASGSRIFGAMANGMTLLYDSNSNSFVQARRDQTTLSGAYAADQENFFVGNSILNASLVPVRRLDDRAGLSSGFLFTEGQALRFTASGANSPGVMQRVDVRTGTGIRPTRTIEAPILSDTAQPFTRTIAMMASRQAMVGLTQGGVVALPANYDDGVAPPRIERISNAADPSAPVAPGALVSILGRDLSPVNVSTRQMPLPTALGDSCITVNGLPLPIMFVSPTQINAQLPYFLNDSATLIIRTPGGTSDSFSVNLRPAAPAVFRTNLEGVDLSVPVIYNSRNNLLATGSNPVKRHDSIVVFLGGMGKTTPEVEAGQPAPSNPLAIVNEAVTVRLGGVEIPVSFAGLTPGQAGVYQINAQISGAVPVGMSVPLEISQSGSVFRTNVRVIE